MLRTLYRPSFRLFSMAAEAGPIEASIVSALQEAFAPLEHLQVINESSGHNVPEGSESHFKVIVVSEKFSTMRPLARHRAVNAALKPQLDDGLHALSIVAKTPEQWNTAGGNQVTPSPACRGGSGK